jgi:hypothetical protein
MNYHQPYEPRYSREGFQQHLDARANSSLQRSEWGSIVQQVEDLVILAKSTINAELEVHIGRIENNERRKFRSGVSEEWFDQKLKQMNSYSQWTEKSEEWEKIKELIFDHDIRMRSNFPDGDNTFMKKVLIKGIDIKMDDAQYDMRIVLKAENKAHVNYGNPVLLRFKERKSFKYKNFIYCFTKIWEGKSIDLAYVSKPKYEIELEFADFNEDPSRLARSVIMKCNDLLGLITKRKRTMMDNEEIAKRFKNIRVDREFINKVNQLYDTLCVPSLNNKDNRNNTSYQQSRNLLAGLASFQ